MSTKVRAVSGPILDLAQEISLWIAFLGDHLKLSVVLADVLCERADLLQDGT